MFGGGGRRDKQGERTSYGLFLAFRDGGAEGFGSARDGARVVGVDHGRGGRWCKGRETEWDEMVWVRWGGGGEVGEM